jgi:tetratricopeptide (TPR) repeat protein
MSRNNMWMVVSLGLALAGCGGPQAESKKGSGGGGGRTAADENAPPPPSDEKIQEHQEQQKAQPVKKVSANVRADFDAAVARWEAGKKNNTLNSDCRSLASEFDGVARSHKELAAQAFFNAGTLLDLCGDDKGAEDKYKASLDANPGYGFALNNLGEIYYRRGNPTTAKMWFDKAVNTADAKDRPAAAYNNLAVILYNQYKESGDKALLTDAVSKLRRALAIDSDSMVAYNLLALIYYTTAESDRSKLQLAQLVCDEAIKGNADYPPIYNTLGLIKLRKKDVTGALKDFEHAVQLDAKYVEAHLNIGAIALSSRQYDKAELSFRAVQKLQPNNVDATIGLGVALRGQRKFDEAETMYKKAAELDPKSCAVPYDLGVLYQDYKTAADNSNLNDAKKYFGQYASCGGKTDSKKVADAQQRIKDIEATFAALEEQKKNEAEMKKQMEEMERQQKQMEEQQKQQQGAAGGGAAGDKPAEGDKKEAAGGDATPKK